VTLEKLSVTLDVTVGTMSRKMRGEIPVTLHEVELISKATRQPIHLAFGTQKKEAPAPQWVQGLQRALAAVLQDRGISPDEAERLAEAWSVLERARKQQSPALGVVLLDPDA